MHYRVERQTKAQLNQELYVVLRVIVSVGSLDCRSLRVLGPGRNCGLGSQGIVHCVPGIIPGVTYRRQKAEGLAEK